MANIAIDLAYITTVKAGIAYYIDNLLKYIFKIDKENSYHLFSYKKPELDFMKNIDIGRVLLDFNSIPCPDSYITHLILWEQLWLPLRLLKHKPQMLHSPSPFIPLDHSIPSIITIHDLAIFLFPHIQVWKRRFQYKLLVNACAKKAVKIIAVSQATKNDIVNILKIPEEKIEIIYEGVSENFSPVSDNNILAHVKEKYCLPDNFILFVGSIEPRKNIKTLLKAFSKLKIENDLPHKLVIVGQKGWLYNDVFKLIEDLKLANHIKFTGYVEEKDLPAIYNMAEVFVFPSLYEGFGLPLLEAMACGCPVVASNTSSIPEVTGDSAILFEPFNVEELQKSILKIVKNTDLKNKLKNDGISRAKQFSWHKCAEETLNVYKKVLNG